jgi:hypothetical protein
MVLPAEGMVSNNAWSDGAIVPIQIVTSSQNYLHVQNKAIFINTLDREYKHRH